MFYISGDDNLQKTQMREKWSNGGFPTVTGEGIKSSGRWMLSAKTRATR